MKTYQKLIPIALLGLLLAGCGSKNNDNQNASMKNSSTSSTKKVEHHKAKKNKAKKESATASSTSSVNASSAVSATQYSSSNEASSHVGYCSSAENSGLPTVDLGNGITGVKDSGAGQIYISFNMGNWSMTVHGTDVNTSDTATPAAKQMVSYLQSHTLPVPQSKGHVSANMTAGKTTVKWQSGSKVYSVSGQTPEAALQKAVNAK